MFFLSESVDRAVAWILASNKEKFHTVPAIKRDPDKSLQFCKCRTFDFQALDYIYGEKQSCWT